MSVYLIFLAIFFFLPTFLLWFVWWQTLWHYKKVFLYTLIPTCLFGVPWDLLSVKSGLWGYDSAPTLGIWVFGTHATGLPIEELGFTLLFPIFLTTVVIVAKKYIR